MSDIVERLEHYAKHVMPHYPSDLCSEAKREILQLRAQVERLTMEKHDAFDHGFKAAGGTVTDVSHLLSRTLSSTVLPSGFIPPAACKHKNSCHRHGQCMYVGCPSFAPQNRQDAS
jgi:hypothetical protein